MNDRAASPQEHIDALFLYDEAADALTDHPLLWARARAAKGIALLHMPGFDLDSLHGVMDLLDAALPILRFRGEGDEVAELEFQRALCLQGLAAMGRVGGWEAVSGYRRALRGLPADRHPQRHATVQNNLAAALLQLPVAPEHEDRRLADVVVCFQAAIDCTPAATHPQDHALLQANLGTALASGGGRCDQQRLEEALAAFDLALALTPEGTPEAERIRSLVAETKGMSLELTAESQGRT